MSANKSEKGVSDMERDPTLSENLGALVVSVVLFVGGGLLAVSGWGKATQIIGGLLGLFGLITGRVTFWAILKSLWHGERGKR